MKNIINKTIEILNEKLPMELCYKIIYKYGGVPKHPVAKMIKDYTYKTIEDWTDTSFYGGDFELDNYAHSVLAYNCIHQDERYGNPLWIMINNKIYLF